MEEKKELLFRTVKDVVEMAEGRAYAAIKHMSVVVFAYEGGMYQFHTCGKDEAEDLMEEFKADGTLTISDIMQGTMEVYEPQIAFVLEPSEVVYVKKEIITEKYV